jgi:hypothetical protein
MHGCPRYYFRVTPDLGSSLVNKVEFLQPNVEQELNMFFRLLEDIEDFPQAFHYSTETLQEYRRRLEFIMEHLGTEDYVHFHNATLIANSLISLHLERQQHKFSSKGGQFTYSAVCSISARSKFTDDATSQFLRAVG